MLGGRGAKRWASRKKTSKTTSLLATTLLCRVSATRITVVLAATTHIEAVEADMEVRQIKVDRRLRTMTTAHRLAWAKRMATLSYLALAAEILQQQTQGNGVVARPKGGSREMTMDADAAEGEGEDAAEATANDKARSN